MIWAASIIIFLYLAIITAGVFMTIYDWYMEKVFNRMCNSQRRRRRDKNRYLPPTQEEINKWGNNKNLDI